jgi:hypothetical protein
LLPRDAVGIFLQIKPPVGVRNADGLLRTVEQLTSDQETRWTVVASKAGSGATNEEQHGGEVGSEDSQGNGAGAVRKRRRTSS